ncbi:retinol dehydrogenase 13-like [Ostrinia nubilalis]|uniref:retinol dehydrogenase 13-like n=1 Tax=Ostrinia nubilalis TaxID=29057 RepID=UPI00308261B8
MTGKVVIVTGANRGIGFHTAQDLARRGARVVLACRDEARGPRARDQIITETGNSNVVYKHLNLSSLSSVRTFCEDILKSEERLDVLVNNAGAYGLGGRYTDYGIVEVMQVNYFSIFMLTDLLLPMIKERRGRVVNVTSLLQYIGHLNLDHINEKGSELMTYANSKFCLMTFTVELARRLRGSGAAALAVHPGVVRTDLTRSSSSLV